MVFQAGYFRLVFNCIFTYPIFNVSFSRLALSSRNRRRLKPKKHPKDKTLLAANFRLWFWRLWRYYYGLPRILLSYSNLGLAITPITHFKGRFSSLSKSLAIIYCVFRSATTWFPRSKKKRLRNLEKKRRRRAHEKWPLAIVAFFFFFEKPTSLSSFSFDILTLLKSPFHPSINLVINHFYEEWYVHFAMDFYLDYCKDFFLRSSSV